MSDYENNTKPSLEDEAPVPVSNSMAAFSDKLKDVSESLNILYIINNAGGRHKFRDKWPDVSEYLFDVQLTAYDVDGFTAEQHAHRAELEEEADMRRIELKATISELVEKSVDSGSLQADYVGSVIDKYGAVISQYLYETNIIERVRPGSLGIIKKKEADNAAGDAPDGAEQKAQLEQSEDMARTLRSINPIASQSLGVSPVKAAVDDTQEEAKLSDTEKEILSNQAPASDTVDKDASLEKYATRRTISSLDEDVLLSHSIDPMDNVRPIEVSVPDALEPAPSISEVPLVLGEQTEPEHQTKSEPELESKPALDEEALPEKNLEDK